MLIILVFLVLCLVQYGELTEPLKNTELFGVLPMPEDDRRSVTFFISTVSQLLASRQSTAFLSNDVKKKVCLHFDLQLLSNFFTNVRIVDLRGALKKELEGSKKAYIEINDSFMIRDASKRVLRLKKWKKILRKVFKRIHNRRIDMNVLDCVEVPQSIYFKRERLTTIGLHFLSAFDNKTVWNNLHHYSASFVRRAPNELQLYIDKYRISSQLDTLPQDDFETLHPCIERTNFFPSKWTGPYPHPLFTSILDSMKTGLESNEITSIYRLVFPEAKLIFYRFPKELFIKSLIWINHGFEAFQPIFVCRNLDKSEIPQFFASKLPGILLGVLYGDKAVIIKFLLYSKEPDIEDSEDMSKLLFQIKHRGSVQQTLYNFACSDLIVQKLYSKLENTFTGYVHL